MMSSIRTKQDKFRHYSATEIPTVHQIPAHMIPIAPMPLRFVVRGTIIPCSHSLLMDGQQRISGNSVKIDPLEHCAGLRMQFAQAVFVLKGHVPNPSNPSESLVF